jgi:hypothetical protein
VAQLLENLDGLRNGPFGSLGCLDQVKAVEIADAQFLRSKAFVQLSVEGHVKGVGVRFWVQEVAGRLGAGFHKQSEVVGAAAHWAWYWRDVDLTVETWRIFSMALHGESVR